jgi:tetratricopeptide (TPR) repeat protein
MIKNKMRLWLALLTLVILAILLIWQFGFREDLGRPASHGIDDTLAQGKTAGSVVANTNTCIQLPIQIGDGDFSPAENTLNCVLMAYANAASQKDKGRILALDTELKELEFQVKSMKSHDAWAAFWRDKDQPRSQYQAVIGVFIDDRGMSYDGGLRYDKVMLSRAEALAQYNQLKPRFEQIRSEFLAIPKAPEIANIEALYMLDEQLEKLVVEVDKVFDSSTPFPNYHEIGVYLDGHIYYTGFIRQVADKLIPPQGFIDPKTGNKIEVKGDHYSKLKGKLEEIYQSYKSLKQLPEDAEKIYEISEELVKVVDEIHKAYPGNRSKVFWDNKYESLGLYVGHYSDQFDYGGKLIVVSYRLNPNSRYREATLVAAISGAGGMSELSGVPDINLAKTYLEKYPDGKHLRKVYSVLATFYQNLYEELLEDEKSPSITGCYKDHLDIHPEDKDREAVRNKAIAYYKKLLAFEQPVPEGYKKALSNLENRIDGNTRYWCTD